MVQDLRKQNTVLKNKNNTLAAENGLLSAQVLSWDGRPLVNALVRAYAANVFGGNWADAWNTFKKELLYKHSINLNARITAHLNDTGKLTKPKTLDMLSDAEVPNAVSTAVAMCRSGDVDIVGLIEKYQAALS
jgi:hypothetical protein